jgi:TctA family transporter
MLEAAISAFENLFTCPCTFGFVPTRLMFLFLGVCMGLALGAIPGLGGLVGLAIFIVAVVFFFGESLMERVDPALVPDAPSR